MDKPSKEALKQMLKFLVKTSVPRLLAEREKELNQIENQHSTMAINERK